MTEDEDSAHSMNLSAFVDATESPNLPREEVMGALGGSLLAAAARFFASATAQSS